MKNIILKELKAVKYEEVEEVWTRERLLEIFGGPDNIIWHLVQQIDDLEEYIGVLERRLSEMRKELDK